MQTKLVRRLGLFLIAFLLSLAVLVPTALAYDVNVGALPGTSEGAYMGGYGLWGTNGYGARVTLVDSNSGESFAEYPSIDFTRKKTIATDVNDYGTGINYVDITTARHFGGWCKSDYRDWKTLEEDPSGYNPVTAPAGFPIMLNSGASQKTSASEIKDYFRKRETIEWFVDNINEHIDSDTEPLTLEKVTNGDYKFLVEPVVYLAFPATKTVYAATVTEIGLWNKATPNYVGHNYNVGYISYNFGGAYTYDSWPRSVFLEEDDLGYKAWNNSEARSTYSYKNSAGVRTTGHTGVSIDQTIDQMGIAIISFKQNTKVYYHLYTSTRTPDKPLTEMSSLSLAEQLANSKETKHEWTCLNPDGTTPTYEKITQGDKTVDLYYATNDSQLTALLEAHKWAVNNTPTLPPIIGTEALEKAVDKSNLDLYPTADVLAQYLSSGVDLNNPQQLKYKDSDQGLGKKKKDDSGNEKDVKEYHVAIYAIEWDLPKIDLYYHILTVTEDPSGDPDDTTMEWEQTKREIEAQPNYDPTTDTKKPEGDPVSVLGYPKYKKVEDDGTPEYPQRDKDGNPPDQRKPNEEISFEPPLPSTLVSDNKIILYPPGKDPINEVHVAMGHFFQKISAVLNNCGNFLLLSNAVIMRVQLGIFNYVTRRSPISTLPCR